MRRPSLPSSPAAPARPHPRGGRFAALALALLVAAGGAGCDDDDAPTVPGTAPALSAADVSRITAEVSAVPAAMQAAWAAKDPAAFAATFSPDARFVAPIGVVQTSRDGVQQAHTGLFNGPFAGSTRATQIDAVTVLSGTAAVVDLTVDLTNYRGLPPGLQPTVAGASPVLTTRERLILEKRQGAWLIVRDQLTALQPGQPR